MNKKLANNLQNFELASIDQYIGNYVGYDREKRLYSHKMGEDGAETKTR